MIIDHISNAEIYRLLGSRFARAFEYLRSANLDALPSGRVEIAGEEMFAIVADGLTKPASECRYEAHRCYHDIQLVTHGQEVMGYAPVSRMKVIEDLADGGDYAFLEGQGDDFLVQAGWFALFMPQDAHRPSMAVNGRPRRVRKVVIKVAV